jgi:hypothetical protein
LCHDFAGISGSFILLLMGMYKFILDSVTNLRILVVLTFLSGAAIGLVLFSNFLSWLLRKYHSQTVAMLTALWLARLIKSGPGRSDQNVYRSSWRCENLRRDQCFAGQVRTGNRQRSLSGLGYRIGRCWVCFDLVRRKDYQSAGFGNCLASFSEQIRRGALIFHFGQGPSSHHQTYFFEQIIWLFVFGLAYSHKI